ncbi:hypothetical protein [Paucisalibacillus globulus]|uniref:hypothetical protein n=1 Tax=Paucisalibacillus globulus TaxID=351095 RepID=UPI000BB75711|nr:hypothetical protein [Paucisalibacillus globulus]
MIKKLGLSVRDLKKIHAQWRKMHHGTINIPHRSAVVSVKKELEQIIPGRVHTKWAKELLIAKIYAMNHYHYKTGASMLDDIISNKKIIFNNYLIEYR